MPLKQLCNMQGTELASKTTTKGSVHLRYLNVNSCCSPSSMKSGKLYSFKYIHLIVVHILLPLG